MYKREGERKVREAERERQTQTQRGLFDEEQYLAGYLVAILPERMY